MTKIYKDALARLSLADEAVAAMTTDDAHFKRLEREQPSLYHDTMHATSMATHIQGIYSNLESILEKLIEQVDGEPVVGADWHRQLLVRAATPIDEERAAIIGARTREVLAELLGFRHVARVNYGLRLEPARVFVNVPLAEEAASLLRDDIGKFADALLREADQAESASKTKR